MRTRTVTLVVLTMVVTGVRGEPADAPPDRAGEAEAETAAHEWLHLSPRELYIGMEAEYEQRRVTSSAPRRRDTLHENRDLWLDEYVGVAFEGDIHDPNLLNYNAALQFGLSQSWFAEEIDGYRDTENDSGWLQEYDVTIEALRDKPISFSAYARRYDQRIPRRFLPSLREDQSEAGVSALAVTDSTQTEIGLSWRDIDRAGNRDDLDNEFYETSRVYLDHTWTISDDQKLRIQYEHGREQSEYQGSPYDFETRHDEIRLEHELAFGSDRRHRLDTFLRWNDERGDLARDEIEFVPRLTLQHSDQFRTIYRYGYYGFDQDSVSVDQHKFDVQAIYTPIEELRLSIDGYGLYERVDEELDTREFGGGIDVTWHRPTDSGRLDVNAAFSYDRSHTTGDSGVRTVRDESHQLGTPQPTFLIERNILLHTVVAHDAMRTRYFIRGIDYVATPIAGRIYIERTLTGRIAQGDVVYFDYQYVVPNNSTVNAYRGDFLIEHRFDFGLTPYYAFESRCEDVDADWAAWQYRDNTHRHRLGLRYDHDRFELGTEYEIFDDTIEPYDAWHITGRSVWLRSLNHTLDSSAALSRYWFEGGVDDRTVWWFDADLKDRVQLNRYLLLTSGVDYHWEDDSSDGTTNGFDLSCGLAFARRYLTIELTAEYDLLSVLSNDEQSFGVYLTLRRDLSHVLASSKEHGG